MRKPLASHKALYINPVANLYLLWLPNGIGGLRGTR